MSITQLLTQKLLDRCRPHVVEITGNSCTRLMLKTFPEASGSSLKAEMEILTGSFFQYENETWEICREELQSALQKMFPPQLFYEQYVNLVLPNHLFSFGSFSVPTVAVKSGIQPLLERELRQNTSLNYSESLIRYELGARTSNKLTLFFCAVAQKLIDDIFEICESARLVPLAIQPAFTGLVTMARNLVNIPQHPLVLIDFEKSATTACILKNGNLQQIQVIDIGTNDFIMRLSEDLGISFEKADKLLFEKLIILDDPGAEAQLEIPEYTILESLFADLLQKIYGFLLLYSNDNPDESGFARIIISGTGSGVRNLGRLISANLGINANLYSDEERSNRIVFSQEEYDVGKFAALIGHGQAQPHRSDKFERMFAA